MARYELKRVRTKLGRNNVTGWHVIDNTTGLPAKDTPGYQGRPGAYTDQYAAEKKRDALNRADR
jgi:hypothetical protein